MTQPKAQFSHIGRLYEAVVSEGLSPGTLNRENTDTVIRKLIKTNWLKENEDLHRLWLLGGDNWGDTIKAVKSYSAEVNQHKKAAKALEKQEKKEREKAEKANVTSV